MKCLKYFDTQFYKCIETCNNYKYIIKCINICLHSYQENIVKDLNLYTLNDTCVKQCENWMIFDENWNCINDENIKLISYSKELKKLLNFNH